MPLFVINGLRFLGIAREAALGDGDIQMVLNWPRLKFSGRLVEFPSRRSSL
jgi:hypothetical protein